MTAGSRVLIARRVRASVTDAFEVFTDEIGLWWKPNGLFAFTDGCAGHLAFVEETPNGGPGLLVENYADGSRFVVGDVLEWNPPLGFVVTWRCTSFAADQTTELHVRFEPVGDETRVTVEHFGWDGIPQEHAARHRFPLHVFQLRFAEWWQAQLASVEERAVGRARRG